MKATEQHFPVTVHYVVEGSCKSNCGVVHFLQLAKGQKLRKLPERNKMQIRKLPNFFSFAKKEISNSKINSD